MQRRLAAILAADVVGFSRLMGEDEAGTLARLSGCEEVVVEPLVVRHNGRIVKRMGDGFLVEFGSVVDAVECGVAWQKAAEERAGDTPESAAIRFRIGINIGDVVVKGDDIYGDGVNVAARLEALAEPGSVYTSQQVVDQVGNRIGVRFTNLGEQRLKNIRQPLRVYRVSPDDLAESGASAAAVDMLSEIMERPAVAVLPFDNMSGDPDEAYFADGLAEEIITTLSLWRSFPVIARNSSFAFKGKGLGIEQIARELGARYVLEGSTRRSGNRLRITAQLIDAQTSHHLWAERYDRVLEDVFNLQDEIAQRIAATVEPELAQAELKKSARKRPESLSAWDFYIRGMQQLHLFSPEGNERARELFEAAIALDPEYSDAHAGLAWSYLRDIWLEVYDDRSGPLAKAFQSARRSVALDRASSTAHLALGTAHIWANEHDPSIAETRVAMDLNPSNVHACLALGNRLDLVGCAAEGVPLLEYALKLNPHDPRNAIYYGYLARAHVNARRYDEALNCAQEAVRRRPDLPHVQHMLAICLGHLGRAEEAQTAARACDAAQPGFVRKRTDWNVYRDPEANRHLLDGLRKAGILD